MADTRNDFRWRTAGGLELTLDEIADDHLLEIERFLLGRGEFPFNHRAARYDAWKNTHDIILDEIDRRGLSPLDGDHPMAGRLNGAESREAYSIKEIRRRARELDAQTYGRRGSLS